MKKFSNLNETCVTSDVNPGNALSNTGVTNHLTPVYNIVTNIRNLFSMIIPVVASVAEDGVSIKLNSSKFVSKEEIAKLINQPVYQAQSLSTYICQQGLDKIKLLNLGQYWVVYFCPKDIKQAMPGLESDPAIFPVKEQMIDEAEMDTFISESDDDEELKDLTKQKLKEILDMKDKVKAAKQMELLISTEVELPREYYFAGVKDKQGNESIALRWKYTIKRPKGMTGEMTRSLINIYGVDKDGVWVGDFDEDSLFKLPDEVKKLVETILDFIGAEKTNDACVWSLEEKSGDDKKDDNKEEENKDEKPAEGQDEKKGGDEEDTEDENSRGEQDDLKDLLK